jgi:hypothetical protein
VPATTGAGGKTSGEITSLEQVLAGIPREVMADLKPGSRNRADAYIKATEQVRQNVKEKPGAFDVKVNFIEKFKPNNAPDTVRYRVVTLVDKMRESGVVFMGFVTAYPEASENDKIAKLKQGDKITVTGRIVTGQVYGRSNAAIEVTLVDAKIE